MPDDWIVDEQRRAKKLGKTRPGIAPSGPNSDPQARPIRPSSRVAPRQGTPTSRSPTRATSRRSSWDGSDWTVVCPSSLCLD